LGSGWKLLGQWAIKIGVFEFEGLGVGREGGSFVVVVVMVVGERRGSSRGKGNTVVGRGGSWLEHQKWS